MFKYRFVLLLLVGRFTGLIVGGGQPSSSPNKPTIRGRWVTEQQFALGKQVFTTHGASCHGAKAKGIVENWKQPNPDGSLPAPPLDGPAHARIQRQFKE